MRETNILVYMYLAKNLGDDLFLDILSKRFQHTKFTVIKCYSNYDGFISNYNNIKRIPYGVKDKILNKLNLYDNYYAKKLSKKCDGFIFLGGSIFMESPNTLWLYKERKKYLDQFYSKQKPIFVLGANFGPFITDSYFYSYNSFFEKCYDVSFRDSFSYNLFKDNSNVRFNPDIVFGLDFPYKVKQKAIGFSIIDLSKRERLKKYEKTYLYNISLLVKKSFRENYKIVLFSFCEPEGDLEAINKLLRILPDEIKNSIEIQNYTGDLQKSLKRLSEMRLMVATRFHAVILTQVFGQGVLPFIYSDKTMNSINDVRLNKVFVNITENSEFDVNYLWETMQNNKIDIKNLSELSKQHFSVLEKYLNSVANKKDE